MTTFKEIADQHIQAAQRKFKARLTERLDTYKKETIRDLTMRVNRTFDGIAAQVERDFQICVTEAVAGFLGFDETPSPEREGKGTKRVVRTPVLPNVPKQSLDYFRIADLFEEHIATHPDERATKQKLMEAHSLPYGVRHRAQRALKLLVDENRIQRVGSPSAPYYRIYGRTTSKLPAPPQATPSAGLGDAATSPRTFRVSAGGVAPLFTENEFD